MKSPTPALLEDSLLPYRYLLPLAFPHSPQSALSCLRGTENLDCLEQILILMLLPLILP